ncbi:protein in phbC 3'region [Candidatus Thiodiazotropha endoloripes]|uniref:EAL domain-containing response regulator n=1 Tax=Candidatus Thiodiazotropha endoloripes TaxID=1818881 RepID=UPI00083D2A32|nr:EAL domain-containing response regulator [Candidatus Thiodiazotropha endoloripes]MCG7903050.1 EAL domain-containing protein [Candidatus Thiodiazotropha weberae]ODB86934.1 protein in phbC 3'region [Candidatus Thiodiazotropha endoloripes]ODB88961.1 protein in phbC 3'region [Candidatus Thiodiazotropha endoloripes]
MSSDISSKTAASTSLIESFLNQVPGRISAILENWHQLVQSDWKGDLIDTLIERISTLAESGTKFGVPQITQSGNSLIGHLSDYHNTGLKPQHDDVVALDGLIHAFKDASIQACNQQAEALASKQHEAPAEDGQRLNGEHKVYLLGIEESLAAGLIRNFQAKNLEAVLIDTPAEIIRHYDLDPNEADFLISHIEMLDELFPESKSGGLWNKSNGLPGLPVAFIADSPDLKTRLAAMRIDACGYWSKPVDPYLVAKRIEELSTAGTHKNYRILIVEDDPAQADFADAILSKANFDCQSVTDPLKVLDALNDFKPDLILMDLYMPEASGSELTAVIREQNEYVDIPIVFLSGEQDLDKQLAALSFGGEDFLSKPIAPKHLISTVTNRIRRASQLSHRLPGHFRSEKEIGLHSRNYLLERLDALLLADSALNEVTGVFFLKIDKPEDLVASVGIGGLDVVLAEVAKHLKSQLTSQDILTRFGNSSLSLLAMRSDQAALTALGENLCKYLSQQIIEVENSTLGVTLSIGIYPVEPGNQDSRAIIAHAQIASRQATEAGGNQIQVFVPEKKSASEEDKAHDMEALILKALDEDYFEVFFQPVVALQGSSLAHYQTLLRLQEPDGNLHAAADFIPAAEEAGLISKVDQWTTRRAVAVINEHRKHGTPLHLFVSQSADLLDNMERLTWLKDKRRSGQLAQNTMTFEFNIHEVAKSMKSAKICFEVLNKMGISTLLTRVSVNPETERVLQHLPISYIKLDRSLLLDAGDEVKQLVEMVHERNIKVIAPQVEDPRSIALLWSSGADYVQGNFVQRPESNLIYDFNESVL